MIRVPRRSPEPVIVRDSAIEALPRVSSQDRAVAEDWLQDLLYRRPELLPAAELDAEFLPMRAVAREVPTGCGAVDLLLVSPRGFLTIVETKLYRNPEAKRQVLAQVLDYAKEFPGWSYKELLKRTKRARVTAEVEDPLLEAVKRDLDGPDLQEFTRRVEMNLRHGRFLLLLVGDEIREEVERLTEALQHYMHLQFTMRLVELQVFRLPSAGTEAMLVIPRLLARTVEIVRATVRLRGEAEAEKIVIESVQDQVTTPGVEEFLQGLRAHPEAGSAEALASLLSEMEGLGAYVEVLLSAERITGIAVRISDPGDSDQEFRLLRVTSEGSVVAGRLASQLRKRGYPVDIAVHYWMAVSKWIPGTNVNEEGQICDENSHKQRFFPVRVIADTHRDEYLKLVELAIQEIRDAARATGGA
jgi:hypothetical protein